MTPTPETALRGGRLTGFVGLLLVAMAVATFGVFAIGVLASFLIDDLHLTRADIGTIVAANLIVGAVLSPAAGSYADRVGGARALVSLLALGAVGFLVAGVANGLIVLVVASFIGGLSQSLGNPATNKAIATHIAPGRRGIVTGLKQSGVQVGIFVGGATFPWLADAYGWRVTLIGTGLVAVAAIPLVLLIVPVDVREESTAHREHTAPVPSVIWWLTGYGFLLGASGAATVFVPLFAEEELLTSVRVGGAAVAVIGISAMVGRVAWARWAETTNRHRAALFAIATGSVVGSALMLLADPDATAWLWAGSMAIGLSSSSWNAVGMLAVIDLTPQRAAGRASGRVLLGFLLGLAIAPRVYGEIIDRTGSYDPMWWISVGLAFTSLVVTLLWRHMLPDE